MTKLEYYSIVVPDKAGKGAELLEGFRQAGVNFVAIWGYPAGRGKAKIDLAPEDPALFKKTAKKLKLELGAKQTAFHITGEDYAGAVADTLGKLGAQGINVFAAQALCAGNGRYGAFIEVPPESAAKAARLLR